MAIRFAGSQSGNAINIAPTGLKSASMGSNAGSAAGAVSIGNINAAIKNKSMKADEILGTAADVTSAENIAAREAEAGLTIAGIKAHGAAARGAMDVEMYDDATSRAKSGGMMGMFGGIAGGALSLATGGLV